MLRVMIIDDERRSRKTLCGLLAEHDDIEIVGEAADIPSAVMEVKRQKPDALFLDVEMPPFTGFDLLARLADAPPVVLVTGYRRHAIEAFDVQAVDYLLKPVDPARLARTLERLRRSEFNATFSQREKTPLPPRLLLRTATGNVLLPVAEVIALQAEGDYTLVHQAHGSPLLACQLMGRLLTQLPADAFKRMDRSLCLNITHVLRMEPLPQRDMRVWMGGMSTPLVIGRTAASRLRKELEQSGAHFPL